MRAILRVRQGFWKLWGILAAALARIWDPGITPFPEKPGILNRHGRFNVIFRDILCAYLVQAPFQVTENAAVAEHSF